VEGGVWITSPREATISEILRVHEYKYVEFLISSAKNASDVPKIFGILNYSLGWLYIYRCE
jgi:acetoin utilization deacetylase AcuC-like enzyme